MILILVYLCESMETLSYVSMFAMAALITGLLLVLFAATENLTDPIYDKTVNLWDPAGVVFFFGTAVFAFEGNAVILEVHHQAEDKKSFKT